MDVFCFDSFLIVIYFLEIQFLKFTFFDLNKPKFKS
jgi:hypothetical protein